MSDWYTRLPFSRRPVIHLIDVNELPNLHVGEDNSLELD